MNFAIHTIDGLPVIKKTGRSTAEPDVYATLPIARAHVAALVDGQRKRLQEAKWTALHTRESELPDEDAPALPLGEAMAEIGRQVSDGATGKQEEAA